MTQIKETLTSIFSIRPGEELPTVLMLIHSFFIGITLSFLGTSSYALFLTVYDANKVPIIYIYAAIVNVSFGLLYTWFENRLQFSKLLLYTIWICFLSISIFYGLLKVYSSPWIIMAFAVCYNVVYVFASLEFWGLAGHLFNVRQGKRLFGLIGSGEIVAGIIGGFSVSLLVEHIGAKNLLLVSAIGMCGCLAILYYIIRSFSQSIESPKQDKEKNEEQWSDIKVLITNRYVMLIFFVNALSVVANYLIDYMFYHQVEGNRTEEQIAQFLGVYFSVFRIISLFCGTFLSGRLMTRFGLSIGLLVFPAITSLWSGVAIAAHHLIDSAVVFFWIIVGLKIFDEVFRNAIEEPSIRILCQPIPTGQRLSALAMLETIIEPVSAAFLGGMLLWVSSNFSVTDIHFIYILLGVIVGWISLSYKLRQEYTSVLTNALVNRKLGQSLRLDDASSMSVLHKGIKSKNPGEVIYCLNMLEEVEYESIDQVMIDLLEHPEPQVRIHVLKKIASMGVVSALKAILRRLDIETSPEVKGMMLRTLCAIGETDTFDVVYPYLDDPNIELRKGAMIGLLKNGGIDGVLTAGGNLNSLLNSTCPEDRQFAAIVLGEVGISGFYRPIIKLMKDDDIDVRRAAIVAAGKLKHPKLISHLIDNFSIPSLNHLAMASAAELGESVLPELEAAFNDKAQIRQNRFKIARIIGKIGGEKSIGILKKKIDYEDEDIRNEILNALIMCNYQAPEKEKSMIKKMIEKEVEDACWALASIIDIGESEITSLLIRALEGDIRKNQKRIFLLLAMIYPSASILKAKANLTGNSSEKRANALEVLDNIISQDVKSVIFPLLDELTVAQRYARLMTVFPQERLSRHERLRQIIGRSYQWSSRWLKACALYTAGKIGASEFYDAILPFLSDSDVIVKETAIWALARLNPVDLIERLQPLTKDTNPRIARLARFVINSVGFASIPISKGYLTRSGRFTVDIFANILMDEGERRARRCKAAIILSHFESIEAYMALMNALTIADKIVRSAALDALVKSKYQLEKSGQSELMKLMQIEIEDAKRIVSNIRTFSTEKYSERLIQALLHEIDQNRRRILSILFLLQHDRYKSKEIFYWYIYQKGKIAPSSVQQAFIDLLQTQDKITQQIIYALFHQRDPSRLCELLKIDVPASKNVEKDLSRIAFGSSVYTLSWSRICAIEMIARLKLKEFIPKLIQNTKDPDEVVRATSIWAIHYLDPQVFNKASHQWRTDESALVSNTIRQLSP